MIVFQKVFNRLAKNTIGRNIGLLSIFFVVSCITYHFYITNEFTPGGDGTRIYPYLKYMEKVPEIFPFWQGHKNHGFPLLADPENHMPWGLILNTESPYFNLQLNFAFILLTAFFAYTCRSIARILGMSQAASLAVGIATIISVPIVRQFMHGSLSSMLNREIVFLSILLLLIVIKQCDKKYIYLVIPLLIIMSWIIRNGYYLPLNFHVPAFVILICYFLKCNDSFFVSSKKSFFIIVAISFLFLFVSMPFLLPILDGIALSKTFHHDTPTIVISGDIYDYTLSLWPFMLLALIFSKGVQRKQALVFLLMGSIHFILIALYLNEINSFFDLWANTPILKNVRWQHPFRELASISSVFSAGLFIDACRKRNDIKHILDNRYLSLLLLCILAYVFCWQIYVKYYFIMACITALFILCVLVYRYQSAVSFVFVVIILLMVINLDQQKSPFTQQMYKSYNKNEKYETKKYFWWRGTGYDQFSPIYKENLYSLIFMREYRTLLSLLYNKEITVQRTNWVKTKDNGKTIPLNKNIANLMVMHRPDERNGNYSPFQVYDDWIIADDKNAAEMMRNDKFSHKDRIIIDRNPPFEKDLSIKLQSVATLTGKTAETISLHVETNKNSIVLIPEMYHSDWISTVDGQKVKIIKAFASMRAIPITSGVHDIDLSFVYRSFWIGVFISSISIIIIAYLLFRYRNLVAEKILA